MTVQAMPYQAWVDDSGTKGQGTHFVFAAVSMTAVEWAAFSEKWAAALAADIPIHFFKFDHAINRNRAFRKTRMTETQRNDKVRALIQVANDFLIRFVPLVVDLEGFDATVSKAFPFPFNHPYFWAFDMLILGVANDLWHRERWTERFEIFFDENWKFAPQVKRWYPLARAFAERDRPDIFPILPVDPLFRDDKENMPLQLADLLAGLTRCHITKSLGGLDWVRSEFTSLIYAERGLAFDKARFEQFLQIVNDYEPDEAALMLSRAISEQARQA